MHSHIESKMYGSFKIIRGSISHGKHQSFGGFQVVESYPSRETVYGISRPRYSREELIKLIKVLENYSI